MVYEHSEELITEELKDFHIEVQQVADKGVASDKGEKIRKNVSFSEVKDIFSIWKEVGNCTTSITNEV